MSAAPDFQISFFEEQVKNHGSALQAAEDKLIAFTKNTGVVSADLERDLTIRQMKDMSEEKTSESGRYGRPERSNSAASRANSRATGSHPNRQ